MLYLSLGAPLAGILFVSFWFFRSFLKLRDVPGPLLAAWTNVPRFLGVLSNRAHDFHIQLHRRYGKLVRFGPNMVSISDPAEIPTVYGFSTVFQKVSDRWNDPKPGPGLYWSVLTQHSQISTMFCFFTLEESQYLQSSRHKMKACIECCASPLLPCIA